MGNGAKKISLNNTQHFDKKGFSGDIYIDSDAGFGFNALRVNVDKGHSLTKMVGATRCYLVQDGEGTFTLNGVEHKVKNGDLFVIPDSGEYKYNGKMTLFEFNVPGTTSDNAIMLEEK